MFFAKPELLVQKLLKLIKPPYILNALASLLFSFLNVLSLISGKTPHLFDLALKHGTEPSCKEAAPVMSIVALECKTVINLPCACL